MSATRNDIQLGEELGYTLCISDLRDILIAEMMKGNQTINIRDLDDRMEQRMQIRTVTGMSLTESDLTPP